MSDDFSHSCRYTTVSPWQGPRHVSHLADGVDRRCTPSCIMSRYLPTEKLKLRVRSSRRRKALLQLFLALGERCTDDATERARNGERDRDRGRPVLLVRPVRVVAVTSSILAILEKKLSPRARLHTLYEMAAWSCMERASGRRTTIRVFLPPTLFDEPATAVTMRRSPSSSDQRGYLQTRRELLLREKSCRQVIVRS